MIKIIETGRTRPRITCYNCDCVYSFDPFDPEDMIAHPCENRTVRNIVKCPECHFFNEVEYDKYDGEKAKLLETDIDSDTADKNR